ncbi:MAG: HIT domain-containing protein [Tepidisphaeraceae bacterium]|jgi:ATP adenylyltransferase
MPYIRSLGKEGKCFLCEAALAEGDQQRERLVLWRSDQSVVLMNRYPYANGHLLIAPRAHKCDLEDLSQAEQLDLSVQTVAAVTLLKRAVSAQGFNIGINLGMVAGAGLPGHVHQHVVPRWGGDTNFMTVIGETRIVPEALSQLYAELVRVMREIEGETRNQKPE